MRELLQSYLRRHPRWGVWYARVERQPAWVVKTAVVAAVLVVGVPLILLTATALIAGVVVGGTLGIVAGIVYKLRKALVGRSGATRVPQTYDDGRRNVRVIRP